MEMEDDDVPITDLLYVIAVLVVIGLFLAGGVILWLR